MKEARKPREKSQVITANWSLTKEPGNTMEKRDCFSTKSARTYGHPHAKSTTTIIINPDTDLTPVPKTNSKWVTDLNVRHKTVQQLDHTGGSRDDLCVFNNGYFRYNQEHDPRKKQLTSLLWFKHEVSSKKLCGEDLVPS
jgi:hypothetical protein